MGILLSQGKEIVSLRCWSTKCVPLRYWCDIRSVEFRTVDALRRMQKVQLTVNLALYTKKLNDVKVKKLFLQKNQIHITWYLLNRYFRITLLLLIIPPVVPRSTFIICLPNYYLVRRPVLATTLSSHEVLYLENNCCRLKRPSLPIWTVTS